MENDKIILLKFFFRIGLFVFGKIEIFRYKFSSFGWSVISPNLKGEACNYPWIFLWSLKRLMILLRGTSVILLYIC